MLQKRREAFLAFAASTVQRFQQIAVAQTAQQLFRFGEADNKRRGKVKFEWGELPRGTPENSRTWHPLRGCKYLAIIGLQGRAMYLVIVPKYQSGISSGCRKPLISRLCQLYSTVHGIRACNADHVWRLDEMSHMTSKRP